MDTNLLLDFINGVKVNIYTLIKTYLQHRQMFSYDDVGVVVVVAFIFILVCFHIQFTKVLAVNGNVRLPMYTGFYLNVWCCQQIFDNKIKLMLMNSQNGCREDRYLCDDSICLIDLIEI